MEKYNSGTKLFVFISIIILLFQFSFAEDYMKLMGSDWHPQCVTEDSVTLLSSGKDYPCHIKAYGWKILSSKRPRKRGGRLFYKGFVKWGWKVIVHNPTSNVIQFSIKVQLKSDDGFILDTTSFGSEFLPEPRSPFGFVDERRKQENKIKNMKFVHPGNTKVFQGVSEYNATAHKGEGGPHSITFNVNSK